MAKDKLVIENQGWKFRLFWYIANEGDVGGCVGESTYLDKMPAPGPKDRSDWECWAAQRAASASPGVERDFQGFYWTSVMDAKAALRLANAALKADGRPLPEWAKEALAAGWKAPKGWKP